MPQSSVIEFADRLRGDVQPLHLQALARHSGQPDATGVGKEVMAKIGRSAVSGRFIPVKVAQRQKNTSVVETIKVKKGK